MQPCLVADHIQGRAPNSPKRSPQLTSNFACFSVLQPERAVKLLDGSALFSVRKLRSIPGISNCQLYPRLLLVTPHRLIVLDDEDSAITGSAVVKSNHHLTELAKLTYTKKCVPPPYPPPWRTVVLDSLARCTRRVLLWPTVFGRVVLCPSHKPAGALVCLLGRILAQFCTCCRDPTLVTLFYKSNQSYTKPEQKAEDEDSDKTAPAGGEAATSASPPPQPKMKSNSYRIDDPAPFINVLMTNLKALR